MPAIELVAALSGYGLKPGTQRWDELQDIFGQAVEGGMAPGAASTLVRDVMEMVRTAEINAFKNFGGTGLAVGGEG